MIYGLPDHLYEAIDDRGEAIVLFTCYRGSIAHGMYVPSNDPDSVDDTDYFACVIAPPAHYCGLKSWGNSETKEVFIGDDDLLAYELRKLAKLMLVCNPNVLSFLWCEHIYQSKVAEKLVAIRDKFVSRKAVYKSFCGYANAQLQKMEAAAHRGFRGQKRRELKEKFGYDTKHAAHCLRLLRMGDEFLRTGNLRVNREGYDAEELIAVKRGEWQRDKVVTEARGLFDKIKNSCEKSVLPLEPDRELVERTIIEMIRGYLSV